jgi:enamine deaminase RidA (YjgF/YER057c/UK114 family)
MSRAIKKLLIGGLIIMTMGIPTAATANENDLKLTIVNPQNLYDPSPNGYSTAVITPRGGRVAYISGQGGQDSTGALSPDFAVQVKQAYANLRAALDALGARPDQVAKLTVFVVDHDMSKLEVLTRNVKEVFGKALPAQTLIPVPKLAIDPMLFEVEAVVVLD